MVVWFDGSDRVKHDGQDLAALSGFYDKVCVKSA